MNRKEKKQTSYTFRVTYKYKWSYVVCQASDGVTYSFAFVSLSACLLLLV